VVHGECLDILGHVASPATPLIIEKDVVVDCVDAVREYNQSGLVHKACQVADMCWSMLDHSRAVLADIASRVAVHSPDVISHVAAGVQEIVLHPAQYIDAVGDGIGKGLYCAVTDIFNHPVQTVAYAVAGQYILEYHLSKVFFDLCNISIMTLLDRDRACKKWDDYIAPLTAVINAITDKKTTLRDAVENGTALVVGWKAQANLLNGMGNLCRSVKDKTLEWIRNNPLADPERYMMTADGTLFKVLDNFEKRYSNIVNKLNIQFSPGTLDHVLLSREAAIERIKKAADTLHLSDDDVHNLFTMLAVPEVDGCMRTVATAIEKFEHVPGFQKMIQQLFKNCSKSKTSRNVKGACNELRVALVLQEKGHVIVEFGLMIGEVEYDIVTTTHIIECKNLYWDHYKDNVDKLKKLIDQAKNGVENADKLGKKYVWAVKNPIPEDFAWFRADLLKAGVYQIIQG